MSSILGRLERARSNKKITVLSIIGLILVPLVIAGILVWALWNPQDRLGQVTAAIVNNDKPVTLNGQMVPLGRQLSAGLVDGDTKTNYTWVITDEKDAKAGLKSGEYTAVVTIPKNFSAAATSFSGKAADAEKARIDVTSSDKSKLVDDAITQTITSTAASVMGRQLTTTYLDNVYIGFNTLNDQLGEAASGAAKLAEGGVSLADASRQLADGTTKLAGGASDLSSGAAQLADGTGQLANGLAQLNAGVAGDGSETNPGLAAGAQGIAGGVGALSSNLSTLAGNTATVNSRATALATELGGLYADCAASGGSAEFCGKIAAAAGSAGTLIKGTDDAKNMDGTYATSLTAAGLRDGASKLADGANAFAGGVPQLTDGLSQLSGAASQLNDGTSKLAGGAADLATGAKGLADGTTQLADGTGTLSGGIASLSSGLQTAVSQLPTYSSSDRQNLAKVVSDPVTAGSPSFELGKNGTPFYASLALWLGALATFLVLRAVPTSTLGSTRSSFRLALRAYAPAGAVGVFQGLLVSIILAPLLALEPGPWFAFAGIAMLAGAAFAASNQALMAVFGGIGRFISMIVALIGLATGIIATAPQALDQLLTFLPIAPALGGLQSIVTVQAGAGAAVAGLVFWLLGSIAVTTIAVARKRTVTVRQLAAAPASASAARSTAVLA
ncbi:YhgE/Pip family protein [Plantibacter sp. Mn2098]|uniref:YhgE/Pip family protein n=1 Tax=Plantibacter sp. Mn2098 TaxID=3395266 RepID=UPI003BE46FE9